MTREPQEVVNERKQVYRRVGYEQRLRTDATLDDLDLELAREFLARTPFGARPVTEALQLLRPDRAGRARVAGHECRPPAVRQGARAPVASARRTAAVSGRRGRAASMAGEET